MKFIAIFSIIFLTTNVFSQEEGKPTAGVELPDFVITGKDVVRIKKSEKLDPFLISTFTEKFVLPTYSPEEIPVKEIPLPVREDLKLLSSNKFFTGYVSTGVGFYSLPELDLLYSTPIQNGIFRARANGFYNRAYLENTDKYRISAGSDLIYWTDINSSFLPGTQLRANFDLSRFEYKFFGSNAPTEKRALNNFILNSNIKNEYNSSFLFKINANNNFISSAEENFRENRFDLSLNSLLRLSFFNIGLSGNFRNITVSNDTSNHPETNYFLLRPTAGFQFTNLVKGSFGFTISQTAQDKFLMPFAELALKLAPNFTLLGTFNPSTELLSPGYFLFKNPYFVVNNSTNLFAKKSMQYSVEIKYDYQRDFELKGGLKYFASDSLPYFYEIQKGKYSLVFSDIKSISPYVSLNIFPGTFGYLFSSLELNAAVNDTGQTIPYYPSVKLDVDYGYTLSEVLSSSIHFRYLGNYFTDISNSNKISSFINLGLSLSYNFDERFDFFIKLDNILNNKNYVWKNYEEKPFDLVLGAKYKL